MIAIAAIIVGLSVAGWWIIAMYWLHGREIESKLNRVELPDGLQEAFTGIPAALRVFYAFIVLSLIGYVLYVWLGGVTY
jgi:hypothetical protein